MEEDRRRGDRTLALLLGLRASLGVAIACTALAFALFGWAAVVLGVRAWLLVLPLVAWVAVLVPWYRRREALPPDRKSTRLNSSHGYISYAVFCLKKKKTTRHKQ